MFLFVKRLVHTMRKFAEKIHIISIYAYDQGNDFPNVSILKFVKEMTMVQNISIARSIKSICTHTKLKGGETTIMKSEQCNVTETECHLNVLIMKKRQHLLYGKTRQKDTICALNQFPQFPHFLKHEKHKKRSTKRTTNVLQKCWCQNHQ